MNSVEAIRCQDLSRSYGEVKALNSLTLTVERGAVFGFLGRNGAGKTTTIRLLTGLARPSSGRAWVNGIESTNRDTQAQEYIGYMPEVPAFYPWMTPRDFLRFVGNLFGVDADKLDKRTDELLQLCGLEDAADRKIGGFSRGMRQRLGLAQSLVHRPPVLFLDEPTSALDPAGRRDVLDLIDRLRGEITVFLSSHILADVERVCDTIGVIHEGQLLLVEKRDDLLAGYTSNVASLEFDSLDKDKLDSFTAHLAQFNWVTSVETEGSTIRITVNDVVAGKSALPGLVAEHELLLSRYEWLRPSLEDIFLAISK